MIRKAHDYDDKADLAPIVLFVYKRPDHTLNTLNALCENKLADNSILFIFADGPKSTETQQGIENIEAVRKVIRSRKWCMDVRIRESNYNKGLANSIIDGVSEIIKDYGKVIVLEDDIITSPLFLPFMNNALNYYETNSLVAGVSGFKYPTRNKRKEISFLPIGCSWGWGTWKRQWDTISFNAGSLLRTIEEHDLVSTFNFGNYPFYRLLQRQHGGEINSWAICFYASFFLQKKCFVYPPLSLVQNIGFDQTGTHAKGTDSFFDNIRSHSFEVFLRNPVYDSLTEGTRKAFLEKYSKRKSSTTRKVLNLFKKFLRRISMRNNNDR